LLEEPIGGLGAFVTLILGFGAGSELSEGTDVVEEEGITVFPCVCCGLFGFDTPDSFSSRRRRICNA
jgi:hypothetical protein